MTTPESKQMREQHSPIGTSQGLSGNEQLLQHFGNYDLVRRIDVGGMGEVYLARQRTAFNREVAVKIIRSDLMYDVLARKRFHREAEVSAYLKHEHILTLIEFGEERGRLFLVTPYIEGGTLARRLQQGPLSLAEIHQLFSALAQAIAYIHKRGVIHRDLKPTNILLDQENGTGQLYVRLIDFGIATISGMAASAPLTTAGHEMGTIAYMAPERLDGVAAPSNDIYSLGVILYQMLTGHLPTSGKATTLPPPLETVVRRCMALNPQDRYASADEVLKAFEHACRTLSASPASLGTSPLVSTDAQDDIPTPRRLTSSRSMSTSTSEAMSNERGAQDEQLPLSSVDFSYEDYRAPTAFIASGQSQNKRKQLADEEILARSPSRASRGQRSLLTFMVLSIVLVFLAIAGIVFFVFQAGVSATITLTPQVQTISKVFTVTANPRLQRQDTSTASIPARVLTSTKTDTQQGPTTGQANCTFGIFDCQQAVDSADIQNLATQLAPAVQSQITQDLQHQVQVAGATSVGDVHYDDPTGSANPPVGTVSKTVTVTVTQRGSLECIKMSDAQSMALALLKQQIQQQYGKQYSLISPLTQIDKPVVEGVDTNGVVTIQVRAAGIIEYQFSPAQLQGIENHIKGMKLSEARAFLKQQPGVGTSVVTVHTSYGTTDTLPNNVQQIHLVSVNPTNLPSVQLPTVQPTVTPTVSGQPNTTPTPNP